MDRKAKARAMKREGATHKEIADEMGRSVSWVAKATQGVSKGSAEPEAQPLTTSMEDPPLVATAVLTPIEEPPLKPIDPGGVPISPELTTRQQACFDILRARFKLWTPNRAEWRAMRKLERPGTTHPNSRRAIKRRMAIDKAGPDQLEEYIRRHVVATC